MKKTILAAFALCTLTACEGLDASGVSTANFRTCATNAALQKIVQDPTFLAQPVSTSASQITSSCAKQMADSAISKSEALTVAAQVIKAMQAAQ